METWADVPGYEGLYRVSSIGKVESLNFRRTGKPHLITPIKNTGGYMIVVLSKKRTKQVHLVHRLVAKAFIPKVWGKKCINHKNGVKHDNCVENLEWCTRRENNQHAHRMGLCLGAIFSHLQAKYNEDKLIRVLFNQPV
jgi:hypothetical protein